MSDAEIAQKLYDEAAAAYLEASADYEAALMSTGAPRESAVAVRYRRAGDESARALQALVRARKAQVPSFEALLTDPAVQVDPHSQILDSILSYSAAPPASAGLPVGDADIYQLPQPASRTTSTTRQRIAATTGAYASSLARTAVG